MIEEKVATSVPSVSSFGHCQVLSLSGQIAIDFLKFAQRIFWMFLSAAAMKSHVLEETLSCQCCYKFLSESSKQGTQAHKTSAILVRVFFPLFSEMRRCKMRSRQYHAERNWHVHLLSPASLLASGLYGVFRTCRPVTPGSTGRLTVGVLQPLLSGHVSPMTEKIVLSVLLRTDLTAEKERRQWCFNNYGWPGNPISPCLIHAIFIQRNKAGPLLFRILS